MGRVGRIGRAGGANHIDLVSGIQGESAGSFRTIARQIRGIRKSVASSDQLAHERMRVGARGCALESRSATSGKIGRSRGPRHDYVERRIYCDPGAGIHPIPTEVCREHDGRARRVQFGNENIGSYSQSLKGWAGNHREVYRRGRARDINVG